MAKDQNFGMRTICTAFYRFVGQLCDFHNRLELNIFKAENVISPCSQKRKTQVSMNETIRNKQILYKDGKITIDEFMSHAVFWVSKSRSLKLQQKNFENCSCEDSDKTLST
jgi:hypothetical protein